MNFVELTVSVLLLAATPSVARAETFGTWVVTTTADGVHVASTTNGNSHTLGMYCNPSTGSCVWALSLSGACVEGSRHPVLVNTDLGTGAMDLFCTRALIRDTGRSFYVFSEVNLITASVLQGSGLGVALPFERDQFHVDRFDLTGGASAIAAMKSGAESPNGARRPRAGEQQL